MISNLRLEEWVLNIIKCVESGQPHEDSRVELKSQWIPPDKAAQRLGGHANAALGEEILWIIGVDQEKGVVGANKKELAEWYPQVQSRFDARIAPELRKDLNIPIGDKTVVALLFATDRAPFVVKKSNSDSNQLEVPWREGTRTIPATRSHLIKLLSPLEPLPTVEALEANLWFCRNSERKYAPLYFELRLYLSLKSEKKLVIPFHRCKASFKFAGCTSQQLFEAFRLQPARHKYDDLAPLSPWIQQTFSELIISSSGMILIIASKTNLTREEKESSLSSHEVQVIANLFPVNTERPISIDILLTNSNLVNESERLWVLN